MTTINEWVREVALCPDELAAIRLKMNKLNAEFTSVPERYTCDDCGFAPKCKLVFDAYNTEGDCLYEK